MRSGLYWIETPWPGRLAIGPRPRGGDWLEDEVLTWGASGIDAAVSLLTPEETSELGLGEEVTVCGKAGIAFFHFPIADRGVPTSPVEAARRVEQFAHLLSEGKGVFVHCRQGIGRAALVAICLLIESGIDAEAAGERVGVARGCRVPETVEQRDWIASFAERRMRPPHG